MNVTIEAALDLAEQTGDYAGLRFWADAQRRQILDRSFGEPLGVRLGAVVEALALIRSVAADLDAL